jgi:hypothetical protein
MKNFFASIILCAIAINCSAQTYQFVVDDHMSPYAGSALNTSIFNTYKELDDKYLPSSIGKTTFMWGVGRIAKVYFEDKLSQFLIVFQHEVFGHGYVLRQLGVPVYGYKIGIGHGWTAFDGPQYYALKYPQQAAISTGGMDADTIMSQQIRDQCIMDGKIDRRDAMLFLTAAIDQPNYILGTPDDHTSAGNDVQAYVNEVNAWYGSTNAITKRKLRGQTIWDLLDPTLYFSLYSIGKYIFEATDSAPLYMFNIQGYKYLPTPRLILAPWGSEFALQNHVLTPKQELWQVNIHYGKNSFITSYGVDLFTRSIWRYKEIVFGNKLYLWRQPQFLKTNSAANAKNRLGIADFVSAEYKFARHWYALAELGYKTAGFIQGNPLNSSVVWRLGIKYS